jgi:BirA family biotin operon repressor/biotin-[acetyl-CoA-carboxylase] ligase
MALEDSDSSLLIGSQHIKLKRVNSTNKYALDVISKSKPIEGTVISASFQYEGRGQIGRFWESEEAKNITCSTILKPTFLKAQDQFYLNMAVSLAVFDLIHGLLGDKPFKTFIKWPNDIYVNDEKIAGILIQNSIIGKIISASVIGTGININQINFSNDIPNPTSVRNLLNEDIDLESVFKQLFSFLTKRYLQLSNGEFTVLRNEYLKHMYRRHIWSNFQTEKESFSGKILEVDHIGRLKILRKNNEEQVFSFREIKFII